MGQEEFVGQEADPGEEEFVGQESVHPEENAITH
jgi:hypothetical protein